MVILTDLVNFYRISKTHFDSMLECSSGKYSKTASSILKVTFASDSHTSMRYDRWQHTPRIYRKTKVTSRNVLTVSTALLENSLKVIFRCLIFERPFPNLGYYNRHEASIGKMLPECWEIWALEQVSTHFLEKDLCVQTSPKLRPYFVGNF